jgi:hypothetical protein
LLNNWGKKMQLFINNLNFKFLDTSIFIIVCLFNQINNMVKETRKHIRDWFVKCLLTSITMKKNLTWQDMSSLSLWRECEHKSMSYVQAQFVPFQMTFQLFGLH